MKRLGAQLGLVGVLVIIGMFLFVTGKEHRVFVENKKFDDMKPLKVAYYTVDEGERVKVKKNKKKLANVKGSTHTIAVFYEDGGQEMKIEKTFKLKPMDEALISIPGLIGGSEEWIKYERPETKQKSSKSKG